MTQIGQTAPDFTLPRDGGGEVTLSDHKGQIVVLYFYPKDDTSGCTKQAQGFTEHLAAFEAAGAVVIGVSKDSVAKHDKFRDKYGLGVILASDEDSDVCESYGVWAEKSMYGKKFMGIERSTFVIDRQGNIAHTWRKVKVPGHVDEVLEAVKSL
ncbi:thioredoxin-dependent thiol peroxidase [Anianabacter salinae]|uniref:thioredoxin-dependent thiol peroxidase n=1 Tax=Anianabacter salinae TaxID=2851023 RepID=UPI00225E4541|nr:thioredoxin-dependent thiol peroxidase [Anianabacter salinae]MBV0911691.1 thioredoxin-dependent thiol peroxidase [Anianabacter salinae]